MSLKEAYTLAHTAQCRLNLEASRPDRHLRYVVGHLMHYESLRLRIVEIEHDLSSAAGSRRNSYHTLQHQLSAAGVERKSTPPTAAKDLDEDDYLEDGFEHLEYLDDTDDNDDLSLARCPSGASRNSHIEYYDAEPDLSHSPSASSDEYDEDEDEEDSDYDDFHISYPSLKALHATQRSSSDESFGTTYQPVRGSRYYEHEDDSPAFERSWELPVREKNEGNDARTRRRNVVAHGREDEADRRRRKSSVGVHVEELEVIDGVEV